MGYDHAFINKFWQASPEARLYMYQQHPEKVVSPQMLREVAAVTKHNLERSQMRTAEMVHADKRWNYGTDSTDTYFQRQSEAAKTAAHSDVTSRLTAIRNDSYHSSPMQREAADRALRSLGVKRW